MRFLPQIIPLSLHSGPLSWRKYTNGIVLTTLSSILVVTAIRNLTRTRRSKLDQLFKTARAKLDLGHTARSRQIRTRPGKIGPRTRPIRTRPGKVGPRSRPIRTWTSVRQIRTRPGKIWPGKVGPRSRPIRTRPGKLDRSHTAN